MQHVRRRLVGISPLVLAALAVHSAHAITYTVTSTADDGSANTLRWAINQANSNGSGTIQINTTSQITLTSQLPVITFTGTINGNAQVVINGANLYRGFFVDLASTAQALTISNLTITKGTAQGGAGGIGGPGGGGGLGAGGALFVNCGAVTVSNFTTTLSRAVGGNGGLDSGIDAAGGGGGLGGSGGNGSVTVGTGTGGGGGGGGLYGNGGSGAYYYSNPNSSGGGGGGEYFRGGDGNTNLGGGGGAAGSAGGYFTGGTPGGGQGGNGGFSNNGQNGSAVGAGGGGGGGLSPYGGGTGGNGQKFGGGGGGWTGGGNGGDFAGGGAGVSGNGGNGGLGGGGGGSCTGNAGAGGFGAGNGGGNTGSGYLDAGGGSALGGAIFVRGTQASLTVADSSIDSASLTAGTGSDVFGSHGPNGSAAGSSLFLYGGNTNLSVANGGTVTMAGSIADASGSFVAGSITKIGLGTMVFTGANTYAGGTTVSAGTLQIGNGGTAGSLTANITNNANLSFNRIDNITFGGSISGAGGLMQNGTGVLTISNSNSYSGGTTVAQGTLALTNANALGSGGLSISSGAAVTLGSSLPKPVSLPSLSRASGGTVDLKNDGMIVNYSGSSPVASIRTGIASAYDGGKWDLPGLTSSTAAADSNHATGVGYAEASDIGVASGHGTWEGQTIAGQAVIVMQTYYGDSNLDGVCNSSDYSLFVQGFNGHGTGWFHGDYNYDGQINVVDFSLFARGFYSNAQNPSLSGLILNDSSLTASQKASMLSVVPEPGSLAIGTMVMVPMLMRRRRRRGN